MSLTIRGDVHVDDSVRVDGQLSKPLENVERQENRAAAEGVKNLIDAGDRNRGNFSGLIKCLVVGCDLDATGFRRNVF